MKQIEKDHGEKAKGKTGRGVRTTDQTGVKSKNSWRTACTRLVVHSVPSQPKTGAL